MDVLLMNKNNMPILLHDADYLDSWLWNYGKFSRFTALIDLIFNANENGVYKTTKHELSVKWRVSEETVLKWIRYFKKHKYINYYRKSWIYVIEVFYQEGEIYEGNVFNDY